MEPAPLSPHLQHHRGPFRRRAVTVAATLTLAAGGLVGLTGLTATPASAAPGALDTTFGTAGTAFQTASAMATGIVSDATGNLVVSGGDDTNFQVARFTPAGAPDATFGAAKTGIYGPFTGTANAVAVVPATASAHAGDIVAVGFDSATVTGCTGNDVPVVVALTPAGVLDTTFGAGGSKPGIVPIGCSGNAFVDGALTGVAVDATGAVTVGGDLISVNGTLEAEVTRLTPTGVADTTFGTSGSVLLPVGLGNFSAGGLALAPAGSGTTAKPDVLLAGSSSMGATPASVLTVIALTSTGAKDDAYNSGSPATSPTTGSTGLGITATSGGAVIVAGFSSSTASPSVDSSLLTSFTAAGVATDVTNPIAGAQFAATALAPNGVLVAVGSSGSGSGQQMLLAEYGAASPFAPITAFGTNGAMTVPYTAGPGSLAGVVTLGDGRVVAAGIAPTVNSAPAMGLVRVFGPSAAVASIGNQPEYQSGQSVSLAFPVSIDAALPLASMPRYCVSSSGGAGPAAINGQPCGTATIAVGQQVGQLTVTAFAPTVLGTSTTVTVTAQDGNGFVPSATSATATATITYLAPVKPPGYWLVASDGGIFAYGNHSFYGSTGGLPLVRPVVGMAGTPDSGGYWLVASDGGIFAYGDAHFFGSTGGIPLAKPIVGMASTPDGQGYWLVASDGGIFAFGDATFFGSTGGLALARPIVGMAATPDGRGYWLVASDGGIFAYGDAHFYGSTGNIPLARPIVGMSADAAAPGYWFVGSDGGIFAFGNAGFFGSAGGLPLARPVVGMASTPDGQGYWLVASDGGIFNYGDATFFGSAGGLPLTRPVVGIAT